MKMPNNRRRQSQASHGKGDGLRDRKDTGSSAEPMSQTFFDNSRQDHNKDHVWKSEETKEREQYENTRKRIQHLAPEQFRSKAKPTGEHCDIFPATFSEWKEHRRAMLKMALKEMEGNQRLITARIMCKNADARMSLNSAFGQDGKIFSDGLSPVLAVPTIWSAEYNALELSAAKWPKIGELKSDGDSREKKHARNRCGRFLPVPRFPISDLPFHEQPLKTPFSFDKTGPLHEDGPVPAEVAEANEEMNTDMTFREIGLGFLGENLMREIEK